MFIFLVWLSEAVRAHRVGYYIASAVEVRINAKLGKLVITWEAALWTGFIPRDELFGPSMMSLRIIGLFAVLSPWLGILSWARRGKCGGRVRCQDGHCGKCGDRTHCLD